MKEGEVQTGVEEAVAPFKLGCGDLKRLYEHGKEEKNRAALEEFGGAAGVAAKLGSDPVTGIPMADDLDARKAALGANVLPEPPFESWWSLFIGCFGDEVLLILIGAAVVSIIINSIPQVSDHPSTGWIDGFAILIAVFIVATVTATNDYNKQLQFRALSAESKSRMEVQVLRGGLLQSVPVSEVVVGDVVHLETGAKIPADGLVLRANDFKANESAITGESDDIRKDPVKIPVLLSGTQVAAGTCDYLVTAVGTRSMAGSIMADAAQEGEETPLQVKLDTLARRIGYVGMFCALGTFVAMMIIKATGGATQATWGVWTVTSFIYAVTIIVVAIPEGLPLAVTISLAYSTRKMLADQNLIRHLAACETMGSATDICSDKTGTLTENRMTTVALWLGGVQLNELPPAPDAAVARPEDSATWAALPVGMRALLRDQLALNSSANIMVSTAATAKHMAKSKGGDAAEPAALAQKREVKGSKTEGAGLLLVEALGFDIGATRKAADVLKQYPFSSERKMMTTLIKRPDGSILQFTTGGSDFILARCDKQLRAADLAALPEGLPVTSPLPAAVPLTAADKTAITRDVIEHFAAQSLRTLGVAVREWPSQAALPADWETDAPDAAGLTFYAVQGIKDPLRRDVKDAVAACQSAGITVRMCTGDNRITATAIAKECGILTAGGLVMEGPAFRELTPAQLDKILPHLQVLSRSSPKDKNILVRRLNGNLPETREEWEEEHPGADWETQRHLLLPGYKEEWAATRKHPDGNVFKAVVGVTGDGTNDAPALKAADVGLAMGIAGTDVAKDASDIIILDDRFSSIAKSVLWGRSVYDNVQKFLQFQLTVNVVALILTFLSACLQYEPPLNPIMMLWVNLIMDTMGALALATEEPSSSLLERKPYASTASLLIPRMYRFILTQSALQLFLVMYFVTNGASLLNLPLTTLNMPATNTNITVCWPLYQSGNYMERDLVNGFPASQAVTDYVSTFVFNYFVWSQIFNEFNARHLGDSPFRAYMGLQRNRIFFVVIILSMGLQALFVEVGGAFFGCTGLRGQDWGYSVGLAALSLPMGILQRFIPVPQRLSDFASTYVEWFGKQMDAKADSDTVVGVAPGPATGSVPDKVPPTPSLSSEKVSLTTSQPAE